MDDGCARCYACGNKIKYHSILICPECLDDEVEVYNKVIDELSNDEIIILEEELQKEE